ncbi:Protein tyrosine phosphatase type IVA 1 [Podila verticillata]|nr:Protein tyrosine phosphatase type IVA 1 [Haplosporangium bisporale]KAF9209834.1 Protein tyrosine phosphatase type IVA 1 [Podila verticillata]KAF9379358.1 Protein tyrosine phosphatase type IVA 1 [Podila verticillata]KFH67435.1 protein-tyrosine phosphatase [Podila verticillata NRRL 6337]
MAQAPISSTTPSRIHGSEPRLLNRPALIEYKHLRFLVSDAPSDSNLPLYVAEFERHTVKDVVRVCDPTYGTGLMKERGIQVYDWPFNDGEGPPTNITNDWLRLVGLRFGTDPEQIPQGAIAVHCVAGLGRAPLLVAIALIEAGMSPEESVEFVRTKRRGALNTKQVKYVREYKRKSRKRSLCCIL